MVSDYFCRLTLYVNSLLQIKHGIENIMMMEGVCKAKQVIEEAFAEEERKYNDVEKIFQESQENNNGK